MAASEENSSLFLIFILTMIALPLVPYTLVRLYRAATQKKKTIHCRCSECSCSGKYRKSIYKRVILMNNLTHFFLQFEACFSQNI